MCITYDYKKSVHNLEKTFVGRIYSYLMAMLFKDTILRNKHVLPKSEVEHVLVKCGSSAFLSQIDSFLPNVYGYESQDRYFEDLSSFRIGELSVPTLLIQPQDDPLHGEFLEENIDIDLYTENENIIFYSPQYGNHFGFYEGGIFEAFSNNSCYTYPAKVALAFFRTLLEQERADLRRQLPPIRDAIEVESEVANYFNFPIFQVPSIACCSSCLAIDR